MTGDAMRTGYVRFAVPWSLIMAVSFSTTEQDF